MKKIIILLLIFIFFNCKSFNTYKFVDIYKTQLEILSISYCPTSTNYEWIYSFCEKNSKEIIIENIIFGQLSLELKKMIISGKYRLFATITSDFNTGMIFIHPEWIPWVTPLNLEIQVLDETKDVEN